MKLSASENQIPRRPIWPVADWRSRIFSENNFFPLMLTAPKIQATTATMACIFSGMAHSGFPTLGNYLGATRNWVKLQAQGDCISNQPGIFADS